MQSLYDLYKQMMENGTLTHAGQALGMGPGDHTDEHRAQDLIDQLIGQSKGLKAPDLKNVNLENERYVGDVNPSNITAAHSDYSGQGDTHLNEVATDPRLREAQMRALSSMQGVADSGGMTAGDTANMRRMQSQVGGDDAGRRNAIMQGMQQRGLGGSGAELLNQLSSAQSSTDREAQQGLDIQGMAQQRALQAMQGAGAMGGSIRGQDYSEQARAKEAQDSIDRFNAQGRTQNNQANAGFGQQADMFNSNQGFQSQVHNQQARQGVSNAGTQTRNQQQVMNTVQIPQQGFQNNVTTTQANQAGLSGGVDYYGRKYGQKSAEQGNKVGSAIGGIASVAALLSHGGKVPGHASVSGDSYANDSVPAMLSPGEVVLPRSIAAHPSAVPSFMAHSHSLDPAKNKEAMLSALKNLHKRIGAA